MDMADRGALLKINLEMEPMMTLEDGSSRTSSPPPCPRCPPGQHSYLRRNMYTLVAATQTLHYLAIILYTEDENVIVLRTEQDTE
jgi:hypothetical protein